MASTWFSINGPKAWLGIHGAESSSPPRGTKETIKKIAYIAGFILAGAGFGATLAAAITAAVVFTGGLVLVPAAISIAIAAASGATIGAGAVVGFCAFFRAKKTG